MAAQELVDLGEVVTDEADIVARWQRPSFDVAASTVGVFDRDQLVAYAEVTDGDSGDAGVHPTYQRRGIGTALAGWMQQQARANGATVIGAPTPAESAGAKLLAGLGYHVRWTSWLLRLPPDHAIRPRALPAGYAVRQAEADEHRDVHKVIDDAFGEWSTSGPESYEDFAATVYRRPGFQPWHVRVATDPSGAVVGAVWLTINGETGFVGKLATRRDQRRRGIAQALLVDAYARAREHGATTYELGTDARTGALSLYQKLGMVITSTWLDYAIHLPSAIT